MSHNFVPTKLLLSEKHWLSSEGLTERIFSPSARAALQFKGLLTSALREVYGKPVSVECLRQSEWAEGGETLGLRRDVMLKAGDTPCVTASTLMPSSVIKVCPWLASLGNRPLGEALKNRVRHRRGPFEFTRLDADLVFRCAPPPARFAWARRYRFTLESGDLLVTEVFFPGVLDRLRLAGNSP
ncbi:MAG TPA: chorismate lyase [Blastocatellia bacterium]|nr:chorismate lyase [Blastocatellia bacterium]